MSAVQKLPWWIEFALLPALNLAVALLLAGVVVKILGESPVAACRLLVAGAVGSQDSLGYTFYYATNFIFTGLAVAVAYHAGLFNIGAEGQAYVGGLGTGLVCLWLGNHSLWLVLPAATFAAALFGAAWAFIPAWLQAKRGSHIVITTIMFNFIGSALMTYLLVNVLINPGQQSPETREFGPGAALPGMDRLLGKIGIHFATTPWNLAWCIALLAAVGVWVFYWHTPRGYAWRVAGRSRAAAVYAGIVPARVVIGAMVLSGALAGGLSLNELMGSEHRILIDFPGGAGFVGIAVALMGRNHPLGIVIAACVFGALYQGGSQLSFDLPRVNRDMVVVIQGLVILFGGAMENVFRSPLLTWWSRRTRGKIP